MDRPRDYHTKWRKSEREKTIPYKHHLNVESKIYHRQMYVQNRVRGPENRLAVAKVGASERKIGNLWLADANNDI